MEKNKIYKTIVLGSGGIKGFAQMGVLQFYYMKGLLKNISKYVGTSIGSIISLLLILGYTPYEMFVKGLGINPIKKSDIDIKNAIKTFGVINIKRLRKELKFLIKDKCGYIPTLKQIYEKYKKEFIVVTVNFYRKKVVYLSHINFPNLSCLDAILMSSAIPAYFPLFKYKTQSYVDGALADPFPILYVDNNSDKILGVCIETIIVPDDSFLTYVNTVTSISVKYLQNFQIKYASDKCDIIHLKLGETSLTLMDNHKTKTNLFLTGFKKAIFHHKNINSTETVNFVKIKNGMKIKKNMKNFKKV